MPQFERDGLVFDVAEAGPDGGEPVVLLHGFPQTSASWDGVVPALHAAGYRTLAPDQRGYSPGARPPGRGDYRMDELVADVLALADDRGLDRFHVVGHDWGGAVGWALAGWHPDRLRSLAVLSTPHPRALARRMLNTTQGLRSLYMLWFQAPFVPELVLTAAGGRVLRAMLTASGLAPELADRYTARMREPGALTAALNWYRAAGPGNPTRFPPVGVPTLYVWSTKDGALVRQAAEDTARYVTGPYRFEVLAGVTHWIPEEAPGAAGALLVEHLSSVAEPPAPKPARGRNAGPPA